MKTGIERDVSVQSLEAQYIKRYGAHDFENYGVDIIRFLPILKENGVDSRQISVHEIVSSLENGPVLAAMKTAFGALAILIDKSDVDAKTNQVRQYYAYDPLRRYNPSVQPGDIIGDRVYALTPSN